MKKRLYLSLSLLFILGTLLPDGLAAQVVSDKNITQVIFDSETLKGWHIMQKSADNSYYATEENSFVRDGAITCFQTPPEKKGGLLLSDGEYGDFELSLDFKNDWDCDSGVLFHCTESGKGIQVLNDYYQGGSMGFLLGQGTGSFFSAPYTMSAEDKDNGSIEIVAVDQYDAVDLDGLLFTISATEFNKIWKHGEFNNLKISCVGSEPKITSWINGSKIMEMDGRSYRARNLQATWYKKWDSPPAWDAERVREITGNKGHIALQLHPGKRWKHGGVVQYKNIQIEEL